MMFLFVGSLLCVRLPSDEVLRHSPLPFAGGCRNLLMLRVVLPQGTYTPLVHAHAGRTPALHRPGFGPIKGPTPAGECHVMCL